MCATSGVIPALPCSSIEGKISLRQQGQGCLSMQVWWRVLRDLPDPPGAPATFAQERPSTRPIRVSQLWWDGALITLPDVCLEPNGLARVCRGPRDGWALWFLSTFIS